MKTVTYCVNIEGILSGSRQVSDEKADYLAGLGDVELASHLSDEFSGDIDLQFEMEDFQIGGGK